MGELTGLFAATPEEDEKMNKEDFKVGLKVHYFIDESVIYTVSGFSPQGNPILSWTSLSGGQRECVLEPVSFSCYRVLKKKKTGWVNIYSSTNSSYDAPLDARTASTIYFSKEQAQSEGIGRYNLIHLLDTVQVEWEE
jgi:hypothetical protein